MVRTEFAKQSVIRCVVGAAGLGAVMTGVNVHSAAMRGYQHYQQRVIDSNIDEPSEGYVAYAGTTQRIQTAFRLAEQHPGSQVLISGGNSDYGLHDVIEEFETTIPPEQITFLSYAQNTKGNALETRMWAESLGLDSITIVTDAGHAPRAYLETVKILPDDITLQFHTVGDFPEARSTERIKQAYKLWCVDTPPCESLMRDKTALRTIPPVPAQNPEFDASGPAGIN